MMGKEHLLHFLSDKHLVLSFHGRWQTEHNIQANPILSNRLLLPVRIAWTAPYKYVLISRQGILKLHHILFAGSLHNHKPINNRPYTGATASQQFADTKACITQHKSIDAQSAANQ